MYQCRAELPRKPDPQVFAIRYSPAAAHGGHPRCRYISPNRQLLKKHRDSLSGSGCFIVCGAVRSCSVPPTNQSQSHEPIPNDKFTLCIPIFFFPFLDILSLSLTLLSSLYFCLLIICFLFLYISNKYYVLIIYSNKKIIHLGKREIC